MGSRGFSRGVHYWSVRCDTIDWVRLNIYSSINIRSIGYVVIYIFEYSQPETYSKTKLYALYSCVCVCVSCVLYDKML